jgi:hypothetical protein
MESLLGDGELKWWRLFMFLGREAASLPQGFAGGILKVKDGSLGAFLGSMSAALVPAGTAGSATGSMGGDDRGGFRLPGGEGGRLGMSAERLGDSSIGDSASCTFSAGAFDRLPHGGVGGSSSIVGAGSVERGTWTDGPEDFDDTGLVFALSSDGRGGGGFATSITGTALSTTLCPLLGMTSLREGREGTFDWKGLLTIDCLSLTEAEIGAGAYFFRFFSIHAVENPHVES